MKITKDKIRDILMYMTLIHECRDSKIHDGILDKFEDKPYYNEVMEVFDQVSWTYFTLGFDFSCFLSGQANTFNGGISNERCDK